MTVPPRRARANFQAHESDISTALAEIVKSDQRQAEGPRELQLLGLFQGSAVSAIVSSLINFVKQQ